MVRATGLIIIVAVAVATATLLVGGPVLPAASAQAQPAARCDYAVAVTVECTVQCTITIGCDRDPACSDVVITVECTIKCSVTVEVCPTDPDPDDDYGPGDFPDPPKDRAYASVVGLGGGDDGGPVGDLAVAPASWALFGVCLSLVTAICAARRTRPTATRRPVATPI